MNGMMTGGTAEMTKANRGSTESPVPLRFHSRTESRVRHATIGFWLVILLAGFTVVHQRSQRPGRASEPPRRWPEQSMLVPSPTVPTLVMVVHPQCACSASSLAELGLLIAGSEGRVRAHVVMLYPAGSRRIWGSTERWSQAAMIPGVMLHADVGAHEARLFHAFTSGDVIVYSAQGELLFHGGITASRNHSGNGLGREALVRLFQARTSSQSQAPVFGCPLFSGPPNGGGKENEWHL